jgi:hypothetical protein
MKSACWMVLTIAALTTALACKKPAPPPAEPIPSAAAPVATTAAPTPEPAETAPVEAVATAPDQDISVPEDFEGEVTKTITDKNYKAELDKIDKEIAATPE